MSTQSAIDRLDSEGWKCARCGRFVAWAESSNALALPRLGASTADPRREDGGIEKAMGVAGQVGWQGLQGVYKVPIDSSCKSNLTPACQR